MVDVTEAHRGADLAIEINEEAPVVGACETEISATPELVWQVLTGIDNWPRWNPEVKSAFLEGDLAEGTGFQWKAGPGTIRSTITHVEPPRMIAWTGKTLGIKAIHIHVLEPRDGTTLVKTQESYDGLVARVFPGQLQKTLDRALDDGLRHLRAEAERRSGP
jgi:hypothetical protein